MSALEDRLRRFAYEWHEAMNSPYAVNMMPLLLEAASDIRSLAAPSLEAENAKLRKLLQRLLVEYRYLRVRPRKTYLQHEGRMRAIEKEMHELGVEVNDG